eukprot:TRINITY_DN8009_c0_g1_i2.p1 TRINITY_DN8009_c0_g1~~TRINITY_DN8009_c0_g1_i2.p1  ORF type:complete len:107 (-),score=12.52 TRINITY_DN8009_c0_g1_i2:41-361(-)
MNEELEISFKIRDLVLDDIDAPQPSTINFVNQRKTPTIKRKRAVLDQSSRKVAKINASSPRCSFGLDRFDDHSIDSDESYEHELSFLIKYQFSVEETPSRHMPYIM